MRTTIPSVIGLLACAPLLSVTAHAQRAPYAITDYLVTTEDVPLVIDPPGMMANDLDPDGDTLRAATISDITDGTISGFVTNGQFTYTPNPGFIGTEDLSHTIEDEDGNRVDGFAFIEVLPNSTAAGSHQRRLCHVCRYATTGRPSGHDGQ